MSAGLVRVTLRTAGAPAFRRALPVYLGFAMVAAVLLGKNGMHPRTLAEGMRVAIEPRLALTTLWLLSLAPAARALMRAPGLDYLRWLPGTRRPMLLALAGLLLALQAPFAVLLCLGSDALLGAAFVVFCAGVHALLALGPRTRVERVLAYAALVLAGVALAVLPVLGWLAAGAALLGAGLPLAFARVPERRQRRGSTRMLPGRVLAVAQCQFLGLWREHPSALVRGAALAALGAGATALIGRANPLAPAELATVSAVVATLFLAAGSVGVGLLLHDQERALGWLLDTTGTHADVRVAARLVLGVALGGAFGVIYSALACWALSVEFALGARILAGAAGTGVAMMWASRRLAGALRHARARAGQSRDNPSRVIGLMVLLLVMELWALAAIGELAVLVFSGAAFAISWERT